MASNVDGKLTLIMHKQMNGLRNIGPNTNATYKCFIEKDPFMNFDEDNQLVPGEYKLLVQIFPHNRRIYAGKPVRIEIKITSSYPSSPPEVRIFPEVFHPNVAKTGQLCIPILFLGAEYESNLTFVQLIEKVTQVMDVPIVDLIQNTEAALLFATNRDEYETKAAHVFAQNRQ